MAGRERDRELLLPVVAGEHVAGDEDDSEPTTPVIIAGPPPPTTSARVLHLHHHPTGIEVTDPLLSFAAPASSCSFFHGACVWYEHSARRDACMSFVNLERRNFVETWLMAARFK